MDLVLLLDSYCGSQEWEPTPMISTHVPEGGGAMDCGTVCNNISMSHYPNGNGES